MPNNTRTWVVVADSCQAKIFRVVKFPKIEEIAIIEHPEGRLNNQELSSSKPGRSHTRGGGIRYSYEPELDPKQIEADKFALHLNNLLTLEESKGEFNRLYVFAGPEFLGRLRHHMNTQVRKTIVGELNKELTNGSLEDIEKHLENL